MAVDARVSSADDVANAFGSEFEVTCPFVSCADRFADAGLAADVADVVVSFIAFTKGSAGGTGAILSTNTADAGEATDVLDSTNTTVTVHPADSADARTAVPYTAGNVLCVLSSGTSRSRLWQCFFSNRPRGTDTYFSGVGRSVWVSTFIKFRP